MTSTREQPPLSLPVKQYRYFLSGFFQFEKKTVSNLAITGEQVFLLNEKSRVKIKPQKFHIIHWAHRQLVLTLGVCPRTLPARAREPCTLPPFSGMVRSTARFSSEARHTSSYNKQNERLIFEGKNKNFTGFPNKKH